MTATFLTSFLLLAATADPASRIAPLVDHHQHLLSQAGADLLKSPAQPAVELPADLQKLLRAQEETWNDKAGLAELLTEDAVMLATTDWVRGREAAADDLARLFGGPYRITPVWYRIDGNAGRIAGYFTRGETHFGYFYANVVKGSDGAWRIAAETAKFPGPRTYPTHSAEQLVALLDDAGIGRAVVLSDAYFFDSPEIGVPDPYDEVRAENDWTAEQVARFPDRLTGFCSFNPLAAYAVAELDRCASKGLAGLKIHFGVSAVDLKNAAHVEQVRRVVAAANRLELPVIVHVRADRTYGREHAEIFLKQIVASAPDVVVQVAHLWGGEGFSADALAVYAEAVARGDRETKNLYFDVAESALVAKASPENLTIMAARIREIGLDRILFASDGPVPESLAPLEAWKDFRANVPLTEPEFRAIAGNVAPYLGESESITVGGRTVTVHLPAAYSDASQRFPVIYLTDADVHMTHVVSTVDFLTRTGRIPPAIVVGIANDRSRVRDLTPTQGHLIGAGGRADFPDSGGAGAFLAEIDRELIPRIDRRYRTHPYRVLMGHSLGGLFALHVLAKQPSRFDAYVAVSPTLTWDTDYLERAFAERPPAGKDVFVMMGNEEAPNVAAFHRLKTVLPAASLQFAEEEDHNSTPLRGFHDGLRFIFRDWRAPLDSFQTLADVERHYAALSQKLHYTVRPAEPLLNRFGYRLIGRGSLDEALRVFRRNAELYPDSANVYDSLGDALEQRGDLAGARAAYAKAVEIGTRTAHPDLETFRANLARVQAKP
jgi:predicted alpha/beta superfamily hydrolase/predicted TIM-barrel fold metal-dependent hydrolase